MLVSLLPQTLRWNIWLQYVLRYRALSARNSVGLPWLRGGERNHELLEEQNEIEEPYRTHVLWELCARGLQYEETWRQPVTKSQHINVLEAKAVLREERRLAERVMPLRQPFALDSQVCLGSFVKGRSSSAALNSQMLRNLPYPIGSGIQNHFLFFPSALNRADGPTRKSQRKPPDMNLPDMFEGIRSMASAKCSRMGASTAV